MTRSTPQQPGFRSTHPPPGCCQNSQFWGCGVAAKSVPLVLVRRSSSAIAIASRPLHPHFFLSLPLSLPRPSCTDPFQGEVDSLGSVEPVRSSPSSLHSLVVCRAGGTRSREELRSFQISSPMTHAIPPPLGTSSSHHQEETSVWLRGWLESVPGSSSTEANDRRRHHRCCCRIDVTAGIGSHASP